MISYRRADIIEKIRHQEMAKQPADLIGCSVNVHEPTPHDDWNHAFTGKVAISLGNDEYDIVDMDGNVYGMHRSKFDVVD